MEGELDLGVQRDNRTLLGMFITIEPPLTQAEPMKEKVSVVVFPLKCKESRRQNYPSKIKIFFVQTILKSKT